MTITAAVPLTKEFAYLIRKNSDISLAKSAFVIGEEGIVTIHIRGGGGETLKNHAVELRIFNVHNEEMVFLSGETDVLGEARFRVMFDERFSGRNAIRATDVTYGAPLAIVQERSFVIYETRSTKEQAEKNVQKSLAANPMTGGEDIMPVSFEDAGSYQKNVTMEAYRPVTALARAGPDDT